MKAASAAKGTKGPRHAARPRTPSITWILKLPMKGTINAIMDEEVECPANWT